MSHLSKFYRRQHLASRVGGFGYLRNKTSGQGCSPESSGSKLGGCTAGRLNGDRAVGSTAGAWWRPSSDECYLYCRVWSVGSNSDICKPLTLHSVTIHIHLSWTKANYHKILSIFSLCYHSAKVVLKGWVLTWVLFEWVCFWLLRVSLQWVIPYWWIWAGPQPLVSHPRVKRKTAHLTLMDFT